MRHLLLLIVLMSGPLFASDRGDDITQSNDMNNQTAGDVAGGSYSSKAFALGNTLGDVDINQCLGSTQWNTPLYGRQKLVLNKWCAAEVYDAKGMYKMGGRIRCTIPEVLDLFQGDTESCILENTVLVPDGGVPTTPPGPGPDGEETRPDAVGEVSKEGYGGPPGTGAALMQMEIHQEEYETLEDRIARVESGQRASAQKAQERRDYAQQTIERLDNDPEE